jgi:hypothetical protein
LRERLAELSFRQRNALTVRVRDSSDGSSDGECCIRLGGERGCLIVFEGVGQDGDSGIESNAQGGSERQDVDHDGKFASR